MFRTRFWGSLLLSIPVLLFSATIQGWFNFSLPTFTGSEWITPVFSVIVFIYGGLPFIDMALPEIRNRQPGMMTLITLAIGVSFIYSLAATWVDLGEGFFWELVTLIDIMLLGHWIEMRSVRQASSALDELAKLMPDEAERIGKDAEVTVVPVSLLSTGDTILVRPGASIPADGDIIDGSSQVNESMITGESKLVDKSVGSRVIAGAINGEGSLRVRVAATGEQTALAGIMRLVKEAQQSKSRTQILADKAAGWLFYIALASAALTAVAWTIADGFGLFALQRVVTVLVIACPHALGLAVPLVVAISTSSAAKNGILVRDRLALEEARRIDIVVFDKTGTLTKGEQGLVAIEPVKGWKTEKALALAAAIEGDSEHSLAAAVRKAAEDQKLSLPKVSNFEAVKGHGVQARWDGKAVWLGGPRMLNKLNLTPDAAMEEFSQASGEKAQSVVYLIVEKEIVAALAIADVIRDESAEAIKSLHEMGVEVAMLTGDSQQVAKAVADQLGIDRYFAEILPEDKDKKVVELQRSGKRVAMVGDGINDAPALARADVGIAIGSGTDVAVESAGIILVDSNPLDVLKIFKLSRASYRKMIQNLVWAAGYNIVAIPLAAGVLASYGIWLSPAFGAILMSASTVIVAVNAQLLRTAQLT
ncbi:MAG: copper-translocating P-type ATPase [Chloroflexi bacterium]|nr:copper-translocating P-type ATPase [Chloroflexota bacterium]